MHQKKSYNHFRWIIAQPAGLTNQNILKAFSNEGDRLVDLRYGHQKANQRLLEQLDAPDSSSVYLWVDSHEGFAKYSDHLFLQAFLIFGSTSLEQKDRNSFEEASRQGYKFGFEVKSADQARLASECGASFLIISGNEAYGSVSDKTSLILSQEIIPSTLLPVIVRGSLGPYAAAAVSALGAAGVILDTPLLLAEESPLDDALRKRIENLSPTDSLTLGYGLSKRFRMSGQSGLKLWKAMKEKELAILTEESDAELASQAVVLLYWEHCKNGFSEAGAQLLPVGQGVPFAAKLSKRFGSVLKIIEHYESVRRKSISSIKKAFPFVEDSPLAQSHRTRYPIVQGPMSNVSERAAFAKAVSDEGALPFMALSTLTSDKVIDIINSTKEALGDEPFGVGLIGFKTSPVYEDHVKIILKEKPPYVTVAGGDAELSRRFDDAGLKTYLHAPTPHHAKSFLEEGAQRLIFEGHEAGGHIGSLGSALLWEQGVDAILEVCEADRSKTPKAVLFAGGIAHFRTVLMAAIIAEPLVRKGIPVGFQLGTAYLSTEEIVDTKATQANYRSKVIAGEQTLSFGHSINMPTRCVDSQFPRELLELERKLEGDTSVSLNDRKIKIEEENRGHLRIAAKGIQRNSDGAPGYESVSEEEQLKSGAYHAGQCISQIWQQRTIKQLHAFLLDNAQSLAESLDYHPAWEEVTQGVSETELDEDDAIAIVGMSCRVPGANDCDTFWENILRGKSYIRDMDSGRYNSDPYFKNPQYDSLEFATLLGAFIDPVKPNPKRYKIPPDVAASIDPIQWLILELVEQALASGNMVAEDLPQEKTTVIIGNSGGGEWPYSYRLLANAPLIGEDLGECGVLDDLPDDKKKTLKQELVKKIRERTPPIEQDSWYVGQLPTIIAGRVANAYNFNGGCSVVDAACASGLCAIDIAMDGLRKGKYDAAVVGAAEMRLDPGTYIGFSALNALSKKGCFPFDQKADGTVIAEGGGLVILKTLKDAKRDGNTIFGLIRGMGSSTDGKGKGLTAPNYKGQMKAMQRAYKSSNINPNTISYIEAHGTGTPLGDESELLSTTTILNEHDAGEKHCLIGSVKAQVGHMRSSAGMIGLIKTVLALHHKKLPPNVNCSNPTDVIDWDKSPLYLLDKAKPWVRNGGPLRAGVNAFGFGGVNYHAILEEAPRSSNPRKIVTTSSESKATDAFPAELFIYSAVDRSTLIYDLETQVSIVSALESGDSFFAYSMECYRKANVDLPVISIVADSPEGLKRRLNDSIKLLKEKSSYDFQVASGIYFSETKDKGKVAFLCPGQGAHFIGMGSELAHFFPQVRPIFETVDAQFKSMTGESLLKIMWVPDGAPCAKPISIPNPNHVDAARLRRTDRAQPAIVAVSVAIAELLDLAGLRPEMAAGHSLGEYTSCYLAGSINLETLVYLVSTRGGAMYSHKEGRGAMAAISAPIEEIEKTLKQIEGYVIIANRNCPAQSTISGEEAAVKEACELIQQQGYDALLLPISVAFHSKMVAPISDKIYAMRNSVSVGQINFPIQSNVTGDFYPDDVPFRESFWDLISRHVASPVQFMENLDSLYREGARTFIELGPGSALTGFTQATLTSEPITAGSCMLRQGSQVTQFLRMMGLLASKGKKPNLERLFAHRIATLESKKAIPQQGVPAKSTTENTESALTGATNDWLPQLPDVAPEAFEQYLAQRGDYLRDMMRKLVETDFRYFSQESHPPAASPTLVPQESTGQIKSEEKSSLAVELKQIFSEKTGYPVEELDMELDLEADLGIDSIKQTEILQKIRESFTFAEDNFTVPRDAVNISDWVERVQGAIQIDEAAGMDASEVAPERGDRFSHLAETKTNARAWITHLVSAPNEGLEISDLAKKNILLLGDNNDGNYGALEAELKALNAVVVGFEGNESNSLKQLPDFVIDLGWGASHAEEAWKEPIAWWDSIEAILSERYALANALNQHVDDDFTCTVLALTTPGDELATTLQGFYRCFHHEHAGVNLKILEYKPGASLAAIPEQLIQELNKVSKPTHVVYTAEGRHLEHWIEKKFEHEATPLTSCMKDDAVILSIGGARGVTALLSDALIAELGNPTVIITGRDAEEDIHSVPPALPFEELKQEISESHARANTSITPVKLEQATWRELFRRERAARILDYAKKGISVVYKQLDVVDGAALEKLIQFCQSNYGRIDLVIHGAAVLIERQVAMTKYEDYLNVVRIRGLGTANLVAGIADLEHKPRLINLGTGGARFGSPGLTAYGSGHQLAACLVEQWGSAFASNTKTLIFGPWLDIGMTRQGNSAERFRNRGVDFVSPEKGCAFLINELKSWDQTEVVLRGKPENVIDLKGNEAGHPMIESWEQVNQNLIEARCRFNPKKNLWIERHRIAGEPYFPGVYGIELMAATASYFRPDLSLKSVSKIKWVQPLRFPEDRERIVNVTAELISDSSDTIRCRCQVSTVLKVRQENRVHYECELELGKRNPVEESSLPEIQEGARRLDPVSLSEMYSYLDEHCEHPDRNFEYQSVKALHSIGKLGVSSAIVGIEDVELKGKLHIQNGVLVDASLYSLFPWRLLFGFHSSVLPRGAERFEMYGEESWDENAFSRTIILEVHPDRIISDIEIINSNGKVIARWERYSSHLIDRSRNPNGKVIEALIRSWDFPFDSGKWAKALGFSKLEIGRLDFPISEAFTQHFESTLSAQEREQLVKLSALNRRSEFIAGRIAAKAAWLQYQGDFGQAFTHSDLSILSERGQAPVLECKGQPVSDVFLSISHTESIVLAAVSDQRVGIDVQRYSDSIVELIQSFTCASEIDAVRSSFDCGSDTKILTAIWAAKEAIIKVCPEPLNASSINLRKVDWLGNQFKMSFFQFDEGEFDAVVELFDGEAISIAKQAVSQSGGSDGMVSRYEVVSEIGKACLAELGHGPQSVDDDLFFDLGCTSISAATIIRKLEVEFDVRIPLNLLMSHSTVSELAGLVKEKIEAVHSGKENSPESDEEVEPTSVPKPTLFWAQWSGSNFVRRYLPDWLRFHFFKGHWHDDSMDHLTDLKSVVDAYIDEIKDIQPHGPYVLGGYCFGGFIVYEIAKLLQASGETVNHIFLLDPFLPYSVIQYKGSYSKNEVKRIEIELKDSYAPEKQDKRGRKIAYRVVNHFKFRVRQWKVGRQLKMAESKPETLPVELRSERVFSLYGEMMQDYQVTPYRGRVTVVTAKKRPEIYSKLWQDLVPDPNLNLIQSSCRDHHSITEEPDIQIWVGELAAILEGRTSAPA